MTARFASYAAASKCFPAKSFEESDGSEAFAAAYGRVVPSTAGRADQHEAPAGQAGCAHQLPEIERMFAV